MSIMTYINPTLTLTLHNLCRIMQLIFRNRNTSSTFLLFILFIDRRYKKFCPATWKKAGCLISRSVFLLPNMLAKAILVTPVKMTLQWRHYIVQSILFITCTFYFHMQPFVTIYYIQRFKFFLYQNLSHGHHTPQKVCSDSISAFSCY